MPETKIEIVIPARTDGERLLELAHHIDLFLPADFDIIEELWLEFAAKGDTDSHYHFIVAQQGKDFLGFACYGQHPLTEGTFDLYWIGVDQREQGKGIGKALIQATEQHVRKRGCRLLIVETENRPAFESTRHFYISAGYTLEARIRDFYAVGNDLVIFTKQI